MKQKIQKGVLGLALALFLVFITTVSAHAAINSQINFQGKITNPDGTNITNGNYSIVFSLYNVASAGTAIWAETNSVTVTDGVFQVNLGASCPFLTANACNSSTPIDFNNSSIYLGIKVSTDAEMTPRVSFTASPYAFNSDKVGGLTVSQLVQLSPSGQQTGNINVSGSVQSGTLSVSSTSTFSGNLTVQTTSNSTSSLQVVNAGGSQILAADTTANQLNINGNINLNPTLAPASAPTVADAGAGSLSAGTYYYVYTYATAGGETEYSTQSAAQTIAINHNITVTVANSANPLVTAKKIYRGTVNYGQYYLVGTIPDNTTTSFLDNNTSSTTVAAYKNSTGILKIGGVPFLNSGSLTNSNLYLGLQAGTSVSSGSANVGIGNYALSSNTTGNNNTAVGQSALRFNTGGAANSAVGSGALQSNTTGLRNTALGQISLSYNTIGNFNSAVGSAALENNTTGSNNTGLGDTALNFNNTGSNNTAVGQNALGRLQEIKSTINTTANNAGKAQFSTNNTLYLAPGSIITISGTTSYNGSRTVQSVESGTLFTITAAFSTADTTGSWTFGSPDSNTAVGYQAGIGTQNYGAVGNSIFGYNTGLNFSNNANFNSLFGYSAGSSVTTGIQNTLLGYNAGNNLTTGSNNIIIGQNVAATTATTSNQLNVGGIIQGDLSTYSLSLGSVGTSILSSTTNISSTSNVTGTQNVVIGSNANAANALTLEAGNTGTIKIGIATSSHTINIGTGGAAAGNAQTITIGSNTTTTASLTTLQGSTVSTANGTGVNIGGGFSSSDTNLIALTLDSTSTLAETANTCTATVNNGALYYNSNAGSNAVRACVGGSWEDLVSTAGAFSTFFGVVPDSGATPGDIQSLATASTTGPCKVSWATTTTVNVTGCIAYSNGRKVTVAATTVTLSTFALNNFYHICLNGTNNQVPTTNSTGSTVESANLGTFSLVSASNPIVCLADVKSNATAITAVYDTRVFTNTTKEFGYAGTAALALGVMVKPDATNFNRLALPGVAATGYMRGVVVASNGAVYASGGPNVIIATGGTVGVKSSAAITLAASTSLQNSTVTSGYAIAATGVATVYGNIGIPQLPTTVTSASTTACATAAGCVGGTLTTLNIK